MSIASSSRASSVSPARRERIGQRRADRIVTRRELQRLAVVDDGAVEIAAAFAQLGARGEQIGVRRRGRIGVRRAARVVEQRQRTLEIAAAGKRLGEAGEADGGVTGAADTASCAQSERAPAKSPRTRRIDARSTRAS